MRNRATGPEERRWLLRQRYLERYFAPEDDASGSPILTIVLILAAFTCLVVCALVILIPIQWLLR